MTDRVPSFPGRVKLTPVTGQTDIYDLTMADEPTQTGTPLNKASLLTDAAAAAIAALVPGATLPDTPNDALTVLGQAFSTAVIYEAKTYSGGGQTTKSITFNNIEPDLVFLYNLTGDIYFLLSPLVRDWTYITPVIDSVGDTAYIQSATWSGKTVSWSSPTAGVSFNTSGRNYMAVGIKLEVIS